MRPRIKRLSAEVRIYNTLVKICDGNRKKARTRYHKVMLKIENKQLNPNI